MADRHLGVQLHLWIDDTALLESVRAVASRGEIKQIVTDALRNHVLSVETNDERVLALQARIRSRHQRELDLDLAYKQVLLLGFGRTLARYSITRRGLRREFATEIRNWVILHFDYVPSEELVLEAIARNYDPEDPMIEAIRQGETKAALKARLEEEGGA